MIMAMMTQSAVGDGGPIRTSPALFVMIMVMMTHRAVGHSKQTAVYSRFFVCFSFVCFLHFIIPGKFGPLYLGKTTAAAREQRYPVLVSCSHGIMTMLMILQSLEKLQNRQQSIKIPSAL